MSRPKPKVILEFSNKTTYRLDQVLAAEGIWAVFYDGKPINLKTSSLVANYPAPKYKKVSFSNPGHAENLAKKLNTLHKTDKFDVYQNYPNPFNAETIVRYDIPHIEDITIKILNPAAIKVIAINIIRLSILSEIYPIGH